MFKVNDLVIGTKEATKRYTYANEQALMIVTNNDIGTYRGIPRIIVKIVGYNGTDWSCNYAIGRNERVYERAFMPITLEEYKAKFPNATIDENLLPAQYRTPALPTLMDINKAPISNEAIQAMIPDINAFLKEYNYHSTEDGLDKVLEVWGENKAWIDELFKNHPNYNGKHQIAFDEDYPRKIDSNVVDNFCYWIKNNAKQLKKVKQFGCFTYGELLTIRRNIGRLIELMQSIGGLSNVNSVDNVLVKGKSYNQWLSDYKYFDKLYRDISNDVRKNRSTIIVDNYEAYERESYNTFANLLDFSEYILYHTKITFADGYFVEKVNSLFPSVKAVEGQKVSRIMNKVCVLTGLDKVEGYNKEYAKFADAINPLMIKRHTVISCHPLDYLTMSFGNSWTSCHSIDKRRGGGSYSTGTLSYMLDNSSFVFYTVENEYDGNELEKQPKINRCMFHMGEDKLIQARIYPQTTDGETGFYKSVREIVQKVIADCLGVPNLWKNVKGANECTNVIETLGRHYPDYRHNGECNVSYLKREEQDVKNFNTITVGHDAICVGCGETYTNVSGRIECDACNNQMIKCEHCGQKHHASNLIYVDGKYYCSNCCFYCSVHERFEIGRPKGFIGYSDAFCDEAFEEGLVVKCAYCSNYLLAKNNNIVKASDGTIFCGGWCADNNDYRYVESTGNYHPQSEVSYCRGCHEWVLNSEYNQEESRCSRCLSEGNTAEELIDDYDDEEFEDDYYLDDDEY